MMRCTICCSLNCGGEVTSVPVFAVLASFRNLLYPSGGRGGLSFADFSFCWRSIISCKEELVCVIPAEPVTVAGVTCILHPVPQEVKICY